MRTACITIACWMMLSAPAWSQFAADRAGLQGGPQAGPQHRAGLTTDTQTQMLRDIMEARELAKRLPPTALRDRLELLLARSELQMKAVLSQVGDSTVRAKSLSPEDFNRLTIALRSQAFDKDKYQTLENFAQGRHFTCEQAGMLLKHFSFDPDRIKAAIMLHPLLIDPENFNRVLEAFLFDTSRRTVVERLKLR